MVFLSYFYEILTWLAKNLIEGKQLSIHLDPLKK